MKPRTSVVKYATVDSLGFSSVLKVGDTDVLKPTALVFAVQRQVSTFWSHEGDLSQCPIFSRPIPVPEQVRVTIQALNKADIEVGQIKIIGVSASGVVHIGSVRTVATESRTKHVRHYITDGRRTN